MSNTKYYRDSQRSLIGGSNYPLRAGKRSVYEGGIRSVAFVHSALIEKPG